MKIMPATDIVEQKHSHIVNFKHPSYSKWRSNILVEKDLYKKCWKKKSLVFIDENYDDVIGISYIQHSTKFLDYGEHGFHLLKLSLVESEYPYYKESIINFMHMFYDYDLSISWLPEYIWWYKKDDDSGELHKMLIDMNNSEHVRFELIDKDDIYIMNMSHNYESRPVLALRGKELIKRLNP